MYSKKWFVCSDIILCKSFSQIFAYDDITMRKKLNLNMSFCEEEPNGGQECNMFSLPGLLSPDLFFEKVEKK